MLQAPFANRSLSGARATGWGRDAAIRCLDLVGAIVGLSVVWPILAGIAIAIRLTNPGPALFRSTRIGWRGRPFTLLKFRSMSVEAGTVGPAITLASDTRVTSLGSILRRWKLDELPQLLNVLKGDMSLVGPRPESSAYVAQYSRRQFAILEAKPGMTSPASLAFRDESDHLIGEDWESRYVNEIMPAKLAIDLDYLRSRNVWTDLRLIAHTMWVLMTRRTSERG